MSETPALDAPVRTTVRWWPWTLLLGLVYLAGCAIAVALGVDLHAQRVTAAVATLVTMVLAALLAVARAGLELEPDGRVRSGFGSFLGSALRDLALATTPLALAFPLQAMGLAALGWVHPGSAACLAILVSLGLLLALFVGLFSRLVAAPAWLAGLLGLFFLVGLGLLPVLCCLPSFNPPVAVYYSLDSYADVPSGFVALLLASLFSIPISLPVTGVFLGGCALLHARRRRAVSSRSND